MKTEREIELEKQVAALRAALEELVTPNRGMGFGGMDRRFAEENARAVLADPNLGTDWVPRAELEAVKQKLHDLQDASAELSYAVVIEKERHQAELQRVAEKTWEACRFPTELHPICGHVEMGYLDDIDLDAIVRGGQ